MQDALFALCTFLVLGAFGAWLIGQASDPQQRAVTRGQRAMAMFAKLGRSFGQLGVAMAQALPVMGKLAETLKTLGHHGRPSYRDAVLEMRPAGMLNLETGRIRRVDDEE